ncbi:LPS-assembly protein LptD [Candidatus Sarmatiella mevalonica]|uniref:LPS-assembly protein LptD n=1 Tax=Candidatus Sarmatiella mevalonica TaxID=2770581 RepID=UPI001923B80E|nr:LPS-assembly protein LptD [Candidatus Sarmatiella mevalonica]
MKRNHRFELFKADKIEYLSDKRIVYATGHIQILTSEYSISAEKVLYDTVNDFLWAEGNIIIQNTKGEKFFGQTIILHDQVKQWLVKKFILKFKKDGQKALFSAAFASQSKAKQFILYDAHFTHCDASKDIPLCNISASTMHIDMEKEDIVFKNVFFELYGKKLFYLPYFSCPTPNASARVGFLTPRVFLDSIIIPFYIPINKSSDITLNSRIGRQFGENYYIWGIENRYLGKNGYYQLSYDYSNARLLHNRHGKSEFYGALDSAWNAKGVSYGALFNRVSDVSFLNNYYQIYKPYLTSELYAKKINVYDFLTLYFVSLQNTNPIKSLKQDVNAIPQFKFKKVFDIPNFSNAKIVLANETVNYTSDLSGYNTVVNTRAQLIHNYFSPLGCVFNTSISNRNDVYRIYNLKYTRNIPEFQEILRYPCIAQFSRAPKINFLLEPYVSLIIGRQAKKNDNILNALDKKRYIISENNLFESNHYGGIYGCEFGTRIAYGVKYGFARDASYCLLFIGQGRNINDDTKSENVGRARISLAQNMELVYKFTKSQKLKPILDEVGLYLNYDRIDLSLNLIMISDSYNALLMRNSGYGTDPVNQLYYKLNFKINEYWSLQNEMRINASFARSQVLYNKVGATFFMDCIGFDFSVYKSYTKNLIYGIKPESGFNLSLIFKR